MHQIICVLVTSFVLVTSQNIPDIFFPFGTNNGDTVLDSSDDGFSDPIHITTNFRFFANSYNTLYVNTNGVLSFNGGVATYTPDPFPVANQPLIAVFWADVDTRHGGTVSYREVQGGRELSDITDIILGAYAPKGLYDFRATWAFIATYNQVARYGNEGGLRNTFQAVLATDGTHSFTIYNYRDITWTYGSASYAVDAQVGFDAGDSSNYYAVPASRTADIRHIGESTNADTVGRWIFRIDQETIHAGGCETPGRCGAHQIELEDGTCQVVAPLIEECPEIRGPELIDNTYVFFYCEILQTLEQNEKLEMRFLFNNEHDTNTPVYTFRGTRNATQQQYSVPLHEKYLRGHMDSWVSCEVQTSYISSEQKSQWVQSEGYFITIKPSANEITVDENDEVPATVRLISTVPIPCYHTDDVTTNCHVRFPIQSSDDLLVYQRGRGGNSADAGYRCAYYIYTEDWTDQRTIPLEVLTIRTAYNEPETTDYIRFSAPDTIVLKPDEKGELYEPFWADYEPAPIKVRRIDSSGRTGAHCAASGDPRMSTFDGKVYSMYPAGQYVMVRSSSFGKFEVQIRTYECAQALSCVCAVVAREGNESLTLDMCDGSRTPHRIIRFASGSDQNQTASLTMSSSGNSYTITMPSGDFVNLYTRYWGMNVVVQVLGHEFNKTQGLCGNYNDDPHDDYTILGTDELDTGRHLDSFVQSMRIPCGESLFENNPDPVIPEVVDPDVPIQEPVTSYCDCSAGGSDEVIPCGNIVQSDSFSHVTNNDVTVRPFVTDMVAGTSRRRRRQAATASSAFDTDTTYDPITCTYADNSTNVRDFTWPTPSGITEDDARAECSRVISSACPHNQQVAGLSIAIEKCILDVKETDSYDWMYDKIAEAQFSCIMDIIQSTNVSANATSAEIDEEVEDAVDEATQTLCPDQCNGRGECVSSECHCDEGWTGLDCSIESDTVPDIEGFVGGNQCDTFASGCDSVDVSVTAGVFQTPQLACRIEVVESEEVMIEPAEIQGADSVTCPLPDPTGLFKQLKSNVLTYRITVTRDGSRYGEAAEYRVFNSLCMACPSVVSSPCTIISGTCSIDGDCYQDGELNPKNECEACVPEFNPTEWDVDPKCGTSGTIGLHTVASQYMVATVLIWLLLVWS